MNHNNIYSILDKLDALAPKESVAKETTTQTIYESVEARGSILSGVDSVEAGLKQKFNESGLQYYTGVKKHGKEYMKKAAAAGRDGASQKELGALKDKYSKAHKNKDVTEGQMKQEMHKAAERMSLAQFVERYGNEDWIREFWNNVNGPIDEGTCNECGMTEGSCSHTTMEEKSSSTGGEISDKDGVTRHTKKSYPGYQSDDDEVEDENKGKRGRPRKHAKKADTGEKRGRGRPSKHSTGEKSSSDSLPFSNKNKSGHDPFGRVKSDAEKGKEPKKKDAIDGGDRVAKRKKKMSSDTVNEAMSRLQRRLTEGVNFAELLKEKQQTVDEMLGELGNDIKVFKETGHCSELLRDCMEIKGYHGKMVADEAVQVPSKMDQFGRPDAFANVKPTPKTPAGIPGSLSPDQIPGKENLLKGRGRDYYEEETTMEDELNELARLAGLDEVSRGEYIKQQDTAAERSGKDKFNAFGQIFHTDEVDEGNVVTGALANKDIAVGEKIPGTDLTKTKQLEDELEEAKIEVKDAPEPANKPRPKYATIKQITTQGDDLHRQKSQHPGAAAKGDNPLKLTLEDRLAAEYESIKKISK